MKALLLVSLLTLSLSSLAMESHSEECPALSESNVRSAKVIPTQESEESKEIKFDANGAIIE